MMKCNLSRLDMKGTGDSRQHILQKKGTGRVKAGTHPMWSGRGGHSPVSGGRQVTEDTLLTEGLWAGLKFKP